MQTQEASQLIQSLGVITSLPGIAVISGAIILWAVIATFRFTSRIDPLTQDFRASIKVLEGAWGQAEFAQNFFDIDEAFRRSTLLRHAWSEFCETLIFPDDPDATSDQPIIKNTAPPDSYFNRQNLLEPRVNLRIYNALPNLLTGTGILGTFVGLVIGIGQASHGLAADDVSQAQHALSALLSGAALAFITSIVGLVSSIAFSSWEKRKVHQFDQLCSEWVEALDFRLGRVTQESITEESLRELRQQRAALQAFGNDLAFQISEALDERVTSKLAPLMDRVALELKQMRQDQKRTADDTLERLIQKFSDSISSAAGREMEAFASTVQGLNDSLERQIKTMSSSHQEMQEASQRTIEQLSDTLSDSSKQIQEDLSSVVNDLVTEVGETVAQMTRELRAATETTTQNMNQIVERFDDSVAKLRRAIADIRETTTHSHDLKEKMGELLASVEAAHVALAKIKEPFEQAGQTFVETGNRVANAASGIDSASAQISEATNRLSGAQQTTTETWKAYEQRFKDIDASLEKVFKELEQGLSEYQESTNRYVQGLDEHAARVVEKLAGAVRQLEEAIEEFGTVNVEQR
ncbi:MULTISPECIES: anti-phage ZorAB system protein ZorA [unclassified Thioalkalivibrio]|uniref:anti-phage ZorAB system protein ZorA n=1 Tax=unclassified Thioalkalivibrio TaxID=2621013 RepID=UPI0003A2EB73|nr:MULTISPECIES: anti-phage ZorAB system protein ZorA [unclassified Thioalkalivibrio]